MAAARSHVARGILTLADGTKRPVTHSPDTDSGAEWTPDRKSLLFIRHHDVSRVLAADLAPLFNKPKP